VDSPFGPPDPEYHGIYKAKNKAKTVDCESNAQGDYEFSEKLPAEGPDERIYYQTGEGYFHYQ